MKKLELNIKKRLLIVELPDNCELAGIKITDKVNHTIYYYNDRMTKDDYPIAYPLQVKSNFICKGSEFTDKIAETFIDIHEKGAIEKYPKAFKISYTRFLNAFIDVIESQGYHWGDNPEKKSHFNPEEFIQEEYDRFIEAESRTFNPEKTLIFEIID